MESSSHMDDSSFFIMGVIYKIASPTGRTYIGKAKDLRKRINSHKCASKKGLNILLHNSIRKYGWEAHAFEVLEEVDNSSLNDREVALIKEHNTYWIDNPMGMNMTVGGDGNKGSWMHKTELREWFSQKFTGEGNPFYGKKHTEEWRKKKSKESSEYNKKNNITIAEWGVEKGREKVRRKIVCYDSKGKFVKEYKSISEASNDLNISHSSIDPVLAGKRTNAGGYVFRYWEENFAREVEVGEIKKQGVKRPVVVVAQGKCREFPSAQEASEELGIPKTTINRAAMYNQGRPIRAGYAFYYKDSFEGIPQQQHRPHIVGALVLKW